MSDYEEYRSFFVDSSNEDSRYLLKAEARRLLVPLIGYADIVSNLVEERGVPQMPDDFSQWCSSILSNARKLNDLIDAATDSRHRLEYQKEKSARDLQLGTTLWKDAQKGLPELQSYSSLKDAIEQTAKENHFSLVEHLSDEIRVTDDFLAPGGLVYFHGSKRSARVGTRKQYTKYIGYSIAIRWLTDARNLKWDEYECLAPSLNETVIVLNYWLAGDWSLPKLIKNHSWMTEI